ncbi:MAG: FixH family protein [Deinococcales bacterium]
MKSILLWILLFCVACAPQRQNDLAIGLEVSNPKVGKTPIVLNIKYQNKPLENAEVTVRGDMTHAGMAPVQQQAKALGGGRYEISAFNFTMSGDWVLTISAKTATKTLLGEVRLGVNP